MCPSTKSRAAASGTPKVTMRSNPSFTTSIQVCAKVSTIAGSRIAICSTEWDVPAQIETIEQVIAFRPAGLLINGTDPGIAQAINKAVAAGIPTVVYDSDVPNAKRHAFLGTDWYQIGLMQGEEMVRLTGGEGKIAYMGILGLTNMEAGFQGLLEVLKNTLKCR